MQTHSTHTRPTVAQRRRERIQRASTGTISKAAILELFHKADFRCTYCHAQSYDLTVDHAVPLSRGGSHDIGNLVACCRSCNSRKGTRTPDEYAEYLDQSKGTSEPISRDDTAVSPEAGVWMTIGKACVALRVNERTIRRRVAAGQLRSRVRDGRAFVWVPTADLPDKDDAAIDAHLPSRGSGDPAVAALERLAADALARAEAAERRATEYAATAALWQERASVLQGEVELLALPAHEEPQPPWWRRVWRRPRNR